MRSSLPARARRGLRFTLRGGAAEIHDRRWKKIVRLMRTSAFLNGRSAVHLMDCFLMEHCLWNHPEQREAIAAAGGLDA